MNNDPKVIDLFSGVGGLSLGAARAGFNVVGAVDSDIKAISSHSKNFTSTQHLCENILKLNGEQLLKKFGVENIDGIIGGPPCQGFSNMGKQDVNDDRNKLFIHFFKLVSEIKPKFFLAENVPGILNSKYDSIRNHAFSQIKDYHILPAFSVSGVDYGAPTTRTRVFFIGVLDTFKNSIKIDDFDETKLDLKSVIRVKDALNGLPEKNEFEEYNIKIEEIVFNSFSYFFSRVTNHVPKSMNGAYLQRYKEKNIVNGFNKTIHNSEVKHRYSKLKWGETDKISRSKKLDPLGFAPTLRAGTGSDKGSYQAVRPIHYFEDRVITPREAARLQGFPDWFEFDKTIWHSFRQIGNSVSPLVAEGVLKVVFQKLTSLK